MRRAILIMLFLLPILLQGASGAHGDCDVGGNVTLGVIEIGDGTAVHTSYLDDRGYFQGNGLWLYQESNGVFTPHQVVTADPANATVPYWWHWLHIGLPFDPTGDLQRGGGSILNPAWDALGQPEDNEICSDDYPVPDQLIF